MHFLQSEREAAGRTEGAATSNAPSKKGTRAGRGRPAAAASQAVEAAAAAPDQDGCAADEAVAERVDTGTVIPSELQLVHASAVTHGRSTRSSGEDSPFMPKVV